MHRVYILYLKRVFDQYIWNVGYHSSEGLIKNRLENRRPGGTNIFPKPELVELLTLHKPNQNTRI